MNALESFIHNNGLDPVETLNLLTDANIVSDNAILPDDVDETDASKAVEFLTKLLKNKP